MLRSVSASTEIHGPSLLRQRLASSGTSQRSLEKRLGVSGGIVSRWLAGERTPNLDSALMLEDMLGIPVRVWSTVDERPEPSPTGTEE